MENETKEEIKEETKEEVKDEVKGDDDRLNGDSAAGTTETTEVSNTPPIDAIDEKAEQETKENGKDAEEPSEVLLAKIKTQVEYYFGNVNMQRDKFLIEQTKLDEGWIPMTVMLNFKMLAALSKDVDVILKALETSDLMEISEDKKKIRRSPKHPLPEYNEGYRKAQEARTVYVKGFPVTDTTIDKLKIFFEPYKPFETIVMRKYQDKDKVLKFKGSVFVQFETFDTAKAFMNTESVKYQDTELIRKWAADYYAEKAQEKEERRKKKEKPKKSTTEETKKIEDDETEQTSAGTDNKLPKGSIIYFSGVSKTCTREDVKECLDKFDADIAYIDFQRGQTEGWVRLQGENAAKPLLEKTNEGKVIIQDIEVSCKMLEGEEEDKYLAKAMEDIVASKNKYNKSKRGAKKGRGARGTKKRGNSPHDTVPAKKRAVE
ncbi:La protein like protein [Trachymyrmex septentrionalis]|uniref:La protein like protein n=1 Tax=Trachymyrmex septentrionalis TaxID=34720 RepID=A0A195FY14_9HYME|nr:PREDICTED: la protein homolog [Trachymyrmex septentrionalis]KYN45192.1 La protein like protein [Trachymyrmex septentrionalis]